jgi:hypothetical protein
MSPRLRRSLAAVAILACGAPAAQAAEGEWEHTLIIYAIGAAIDGESQIGDLVVPVDMSMSDIFEALEFGAMGAYRADNGTWSFTVDATYMGLGGSAATERGILSGDVDLDQYTLMATVGRRISPRFEALFSLLYLDLSADLEATIQLPNQSPITRRASTGANWVDPLVGLQFSTPIGADWRFALRGDIGGFGIGSDLNYQMLATFRWQANERFGAGFGYRLISFDYEEGRDADYLRFDLTEQGPLVGVTISF